METFKRHLGATKGTWKASKTPGSITLLFYNEGVRAHSIYHAPDRLLRSGHSQSE